MNFGRNTGTANSARSHTLMVVEALLAWVIIDGVCDVTRM